MEQLPGAGPEPFGMLARRPVCRRWQRSTQSHHTLGVKFFRAIRNWFTSRRSKGTS